MKNLETIKCNGCGQKLGKFKKCKKCKKHSIKSRTNEDEKIYKEFFDSLEETISSGLLPDRYAYARQNVDVLKYFWTIGCPYVEPEIGIHKVKLTKKRKKNLTKSDLLDTKIFLSREEMILVTAQRDFFFGIKNNNVELLMSALSRGAEPRGCSNEIRFPLHFVSENGYPEIAKLLLENGIPANSLDKDRETPLQKALQGGHLRVCRLLLQYGACYKTQIPEHSPDRVAPKCSSLKHLFEKIKHCFKCTRQGSEEVVKILHDCLVAKDFVLYRILVNCVDNSGRTLMGTAIHRGHRHLVPTLVALRLQDSTT